MYGKKNKSHVKSRNIQEIFKNKVLQGRPCGRQTRMSLYSARQKKARVSCVVWWVEHQSSFHCCTWYMYGPGTSPPLVFTMILNTYYNKCVVVYYIYYTGTVK